jgi:hypothetical protein
VGHISDVFKIFFRKPEVKRPLGISEQRYDNNIKMDLRGTQWNSVDWMHLCQDWDLWQVIVNVVMNLDFP